MTAKIRWNVVHKAWLDIAGLWQKTYEKKSWETDMYDFGLCDTLRRKLTNRVINPLEYHEMKVVVFDEHMKLQKKNPGKSYVYLWPTTVQGAKQRAAFCRKQAKIVFNKYLKPKKPKAKKIKPVVFILNQEQHIPKSALRKRKLKPCQTSKMAPSTTGVDSGKLPKSERTTVKASTTPKAKKSAQTPTISTHKRVTRKKPSSRLARTK